MRELKDIVTRYGMEWRYYVQHDPYFEKRYVYSNPLTGWEIEIVWEYVASFSGSVRYWVVYTEGTRSCYSKDIRNAMQKAKGIVMTWENDKVKWCECLRASGVVHFLMKGYVPYIQVSPKDGRWCVRCLTSAHKRKMCDTLEEGKTVATMWLVDMELDK